MRFWPLLIVALLGCDDGRSPADAGSESAFDAASSDATPSTCGTADLPLPPGLDELKWGDGSAETDVRSQGWQITVNGTDYAINDQVLWEAVRFEVERPARIHGFAVKWSGLPDDVDPLRELAAGLYPDFGYNGFDFWQWEPLWTGTRCAGDVAPDAWLTYVPAVPIELPVPGLIYVAHLVESSADPVLGLDVDVPESEDCSQFCHCHSSINLPYVETRSFYNGVTFQLQYNLQVRLYLEYTEPLPERTLFKPMPFSPQRWRVSFGDYDDDGWDDVVTEGPTLYHNEDGRLADVTASSGIAALRLSGGGGVWGDYDNDGCLDLFVFSESLTAPDALLHSNCDGTFSDATAGSGISDVQSYNDCGNPANIHAPTAAAAWIDLDADGLIDLYLANYECNMTYYSDNVWHNLGDGVFDNWSGSHGFSTARQASRGAAPIDFDTDGDVDLPINTYRLQPDLFYRNQGDGSVVESASALGLAGRPHRGSFGHTIGLAWGDLDGDGRFDLVAANLAHPRFYGISDKTEILLQQPDATFVDLSGDWAQPHSDAGLRYQETHSVPALADFDDDGSLDLIITAVYDGRPTDFYWGNGDGTFRLDAWRSGLTTTNGWGVASADLDHDGDLDVFAGIPFENTLSADERGHYLALRVVGDVAANRAALGASVRVTAGGASYLRHVQGGTGQGGQDSQTLHFGLGSATSVDAIAVTFPGGTRVDFAGPIAVDQRVRVSESGTIATW